MKEIVVISGKGGTGKTSIVGAFAALAGNAVLADCDVDAADLHLILNPEVKETHDFVGGKRARIVADKCAGCGKCREVCNFDAVSLDGPANSVVERTYTIDPIACEGCGVCVHFCPVDAIEFKDTVNGQWFISDTRFGPMVHARLGIAQENSGKLVSLIRKEARRIATERNSSFLIVDGSPGIGCPVIASISGADLVLAVTEPTMSARHDLDRVVELTAHFAVLTAICINKFDINTEIAAEIEKTAHQKGLKVLGKIPYDVAVTKAQILAKSIIEYCRVGFSPPVLQPTSSVGQAPPYLKRQIESLWQSTMDMLKTKEPT